MRHLIHEWRVECGEEFCDYRLDLVEGAALDEEILAEDEFYLETSWQVKRDDEWSHDGGTVFSTAVLAPLIKALHSLPGGSDV